MITEQMGLTGYTSRLVIHTCLNFNLYKFIGCQVKVKFTKEASYSKDVLKQQSETP